MVFNTTIYDPSNNNYNTNYDTYIFGNNNIAVDGGKYYNNKFQKIMASFIVDSGDSVLGGNLLVYNELNCYGNISNKINSKLNVCITDQNNTIAPFLSNLVNVDNYQFMDENGNIIERQNAIYGNKYYIITNGTSFISNSVFREIIYQVESTVGIYLNEYSKTNSQNYGYSDITLNSNKYIKWNYLFTLSPIPIILYMYGLRNNGNPQTPQNYLRVTISSTGAVFTSIHI